MPEIKNRYTVRSQTTDLPGRTLNHARTNHWIIDSPSGPNESTTTGESFFSGMAACGVSLVELWAQRNNMPFGTLGVSIDAVRTEESMPDFAWIDVHFTYTGVTDENASNLTEVWKENCPLYRAVAKSTTVNVDYEVATGAETRQAVGASS
jgi:uncharacterized OsmC-like protein